MLYHNRQFLSSVFPRGCTLLIAVVLQISQLCCWHPTTCPHNKIPTAKSAETAAHAICRVDEVAVRTRRSVLAFAPVHAARKYHVSTCLNDDRTAPIVKRGPSVAMLAVVLLVPTGGKTLNPCPRSTANNPTQTPRIPLARERPQAASRRGLIKMFLFVVNIGRNAQRLTPSPACKTAFKFSGNPSQIKRCCCAAAHSFVVVRLPRHTGLARF